MRTATLTKQQVRDNAKALKLTPGEKDAQAAGLKIERKYRADGSYSWRAPFKPNEHGKLTRDGEKVLDMMLPSMKASDALHQERQSKIERVAMRDREGRTQFLDAAVADETARELGWGNSRVRGAYVCRGVDGMLFRWLGDWMPLGVRCLGTPITGSRIVSKRGVQHDPDGEPWVWISGRGWVRG